MPPRFSPKISQQSKSITYQFIISASPSWTTLCLIFSNYLYYICWAHHGTSESMLRPDCISVTKVAYFIHLIDCSDRLLLGIIFETQRSERTCHSANEKRYFTGAKPHLVAYFIDGLLFLFIHIHAFFHSLHLGPHTTNNPERKE